VKRVERQQDIALSDQHEELAAIYPRKDEFDRRELTRGWRRWCDVREGDPRPEYERRRKQRGT
jgi:hypothetical protein